MAGRGAGIDDNDLSWGVGVGREELDFGCEQLELPPVQGAGREWVVLLARGVGRKDTVEMGGGWETRLAVGIHLFHARGGLNRAWLFIIVFTVFPPFSWLRPERGPLVILNLQIPVWPDLPQKSRPLQ